jgi:predicted RNA-binding Zn-ribbon protein involved in translation (DUF1610 family)
MNEKIIIQEIQSLYMALNKVVLPLYRFKNCPKCGGNVMNILRLSPTRESIEYSCENCGEVMKAKIIVGGNSVEALTIQNSIKSKMYDLVSLIGDEVHKREIDIAFTINKS